MRSPCLVVLWFAVCSACAGVSVRPETVRADSLPVVSLSADSARELAAHVEAAMDAVSRLDYPEAEQRARQALEIDPRSARARAVLGSVLCQQSARVDPPDLFLANAGEGELLLAEQLAPADPLVGWMHAVMLADAGHLSAAAAVAEAALGRTADAPPAQRAALLGAAGNYRYELGEERAAVPHLQAYLALRPEDAAAWFRLGASLLRMAEVPSGARPNSLVAAQSQAEAAAAAFRRSAERVQDDEDAALAVGAALLRAAELAAERRLPNEADLRRQAEQQFRAVADRFQGSAEPLFRLGVLAETRGDAAAAREAYTQALVRDPEHLGSLLNLAASRDREGADADADVRELLERALRVDAGQGLLVGNERSRIEARLAVPVSVSGRGATRP